MDEAIQLSLLAAFAMLGAVAFGYNPAAMLLEILGGIWNAFVDAVASAVNPF